MAAAFRFNSNSSAPANNTGNNDTWKAQGFINQYLPGAEGNSKFGTVALKIVDKDQAHIIDWCKGGDADKRTCIAMRPVIVDGAIEYVETEVELTCLEWIKENMVLDYNEPKPEGTKFNMPQRKAP